MKHTFQNLVISCSWLCLLVVVCCLSSHAQQDKQPFEFAGVPDTVVLTAGTENKIQVWNNTTRPLSLKVALIDEPVGASERLSSIIGLEKNVLKIDPATMAVIVLRGKPDVTLKPGTTLTAQLVVSDDASGVVKRKALKVGMESPRPPVLTSAVSSYKAKAYYNPLSSSKHETKAFEVPLALTTTVAANEVDNLFKNKKDVAFLTEKNEGQTALAQYVEAKTGLPGGTTGIVLGLKSDGTPGEYTGNLSTIKTEDGKPVTLSIVATHYWVFPAIACFIGILMYYVMQWYLNVLRKVWELQAREKMLGVTFEKASQTFISTIANSANEKDSIAEDFTEQKAALLKNIRALRFKSLIKLDENSEEYEGVDKQLKELDEVARSWSEFAKNGLNPLNQALRKAEADFDVRPPDKTLTEPKPLIAIEAQKSLAPTGPVFIGQFKTRLAKMNELLPRMITWDTLNAKASLLWHKLDEIINAADFNKREPLRQEAIKSDKNKAFTLWRTLWTKDSFDPVIVAGDLSELANSVALYVGETPKLDKPLAAIAISRGGPGVETPSIILLERIVRKRIAWDVFYLLLVTAVAIYTGLKQFYFDHPFGDTRDYIDAMVWGFGTKALIDLVTGAINRFWPTAIT
jgi:hypothetical protein